MEVEDGFHAQFDPASTRTQPISSHTDAFSSSRARSAIARIQTPPRDVVIPEFKSNRRAHSANSSKSMSSKAIFPKPARKEPDTPRSRYSDNYPGTFSPKAALRPSSPTRRHNPHPSKSFLHWGLPTEKDAPAQVEGLRGHRDSLEQSTTRKFYHDYHGKPGELPPENDMLTALTKIKPPVVEPTSRMYGKHNCQAFAVTQKSLPDVHHLKGQAGSNHPALSMAVRKESAPAVEAWLDKARPEEHTAIMKMMKSAEDSCVKKSIEKTMRSSAVPGVHKWLEKAKDDERAVAVRLFERLASNPNTTYQREMQRSNQRSAKTMKRSLSEGSYVVLKENMANQDRRRSVTDHVDHSGLLHMEPSVWHHRTVRDPPPRVVHRGSVFGSSSRPKASHFTIHPEWPDYD